MMIGDGGCQLEEQRILMIIRPIPDDCNAPETDESRRQVSEAACVIGKHFRHPVSGRTKYYSIARNA